VAKWTIIYSDGTIAKDGLGYGVIVSEDGTSETALDMSWLPDPILAVQSVDGVTCTIENGNRTTEERTSNLENVATNSLTWWSNVESTWQAAHDAQLALDAYRASTR
jgi:hypothetical protein